MRTFHYQRTLRTTLAVAMLLGQAGPAAMAAGASSPVDLLVQKAQSLEARDREDLAAQVWQQILVANPDHPAALAHLARWAKRSNRSDEANTFLNRLRKVSPESAELSTVNVAEVSGQAKSKLDEAARLAGEQRFDEAMRMYREAFGSTPPAGRWAISYYETMGGTQGGAEPAIKALKDLAARFPNVADYRVAAGRLLTYNGATRLEGVALLANISGSTSAAGKARMAWRQALVWERQNPLYSASVQAYLNRYADSELAEATNSMRSQAALRNVVVTPETREEQAGYAALKAGNLEQAEQHFHAALKNGDSARSHAGLGFVAMKKDDFDGAVKQFEAAASLPAAGAEVKAGLHDAMLFRTMQHADKAAQEQDWSHAADLYKSALASSPGNSDALRGAGGALLAAQHPGQALPFLKKAVAQQPTSESAWMSLVKATLESGDAKAALQAMSTVPETVAEKLGSHVEWKALKARAYRADGSTDQALSLYREVISSDTAPLPVATQVQLASLALDFEQPSQAVIYSRRGVELAPANVAAQELLVSSLVASKQLAEAQVALNAMTASAQSTASADAGFQQSLAAIKEASGDLAGARSILEGLLAKKTVGNGTARTALRLHLADVNAKLGNTADAETTLTELSELQPNDAAIWRPRLLLLNQLHKSSEIVAVFARVPQPVALRLGQEGDIVTVLASAHAATGRTEHAMRLLETYISRTGSSDGSGAVKQKLQLGWILLDTPNSGNHLYRVLEDVDSYTTLSQDEKKQLSDLWATWILRTADAARKAGDGARSLALLEQGAQSYRNNANLQRALAGELLAAGNSKRALNVYSNWGLTGGQPDDYAGAIGAALAEHNLPYASAWTDAAMAKWPTDPKVLTVAGEVAQARGDLKHAKQLWKEAVTQKQAQSDRAMASKASPNGLKSLLVGAGPANDESSFKSSLLADGESAVAVHLSSYDNRGSAISSNGGAAPGALSFSGGNPLRLSPMVRAVMERPAADSVEDKLASIESRNTPYLTSRMSVWSRGGQAGFNRLFIQQAEFEASTTIADTLRASLILKPTYLMGGTADGTGTSLFGTQSAPSSFGPQSASGVGAEAALSSSSIGVRIGTTPRGFLTNSWVGGVRVQPWNGPITFLLERDNVRDTMLAYAGARDPITNQIMGGVMSNSASVLGRWGNSSSGIYASLGYQSLNGRNVAKNTGFNGNLGTWWKLMNTPDGNLTAGMNFSGMGYDRNLRYFTLGQGGYFSPQQYFLFSIPVRWTGTHGRLQYTIGGSLGLQRFTEEASDYFPNDSALQARLKSQYPALVSTGANFAFDTRVGYQLAPHWMLGAFMTANNARNYTAASGGLFVKYTFEERPMSFLETVPSIPDWRGQQPFSF